MALPQYLIHAMLVGAETLAVWMMGSGPPLVLGTTTVILFEGGVVIGRCKRWEMGARFGGNDRVKKRRCIRMFRTAINNTGLGVNDNKDSHE